MPDAVAALYARGKIRDDRRGAESMGDVDRLEHQLAGRRRILRSNLHLSDALAPFAALYAQLFVSARTLPSLRVRRASTPWRIQTSSCASFLSNRAACLASTSSAARFCST